ncbi:hypothetical protein A9Q84_13020 [Halobacteriovorax marinus]|uniref:Lipoprotein n=1 Tax=Halobacteriovorax marinus TaxID=97084 RepID=A0A1Y5FCQ3_9BACT|nr:hypothetical protein A9Q84_13020 [Halobacteriovorax marinus]
MKTILTLVFLMASMNITAAPTLKYEKCSDNDIQLLNSATVDGNKALSSVITDEVTTNFDSCVVSKPRFIYPMVCGITIQNVDYFKITNKENNSTYEIAVDTSHKACMRIRIRPLITSFKYKLKARRFTDPIEM